MGGGRLGLLGVFREQLERVEELVDVRRTLVTGRVEHDDPVDHVALNGDVYPANSAFGKREAGGRHVDTVPGVSRRGLGDLPLEGLNDLFDDELVHPVRWRLLRQGSVTHDVHAIPVLHEVAGETGLGAVGFVLVVRLRLSRHAYRAARTGRGERFEYGSGGLE